MRVLALAKWLLSRVTVVDNYCRRCGRATEAFTVPDQTWRRVTDDGPPLCFRHFDAAARRRGLHPVWQVRLA